LATRGRSPRAKDRKAVEGRLFLQLERTFVCRTCSKFGKTRTTCCLPDCALSVSSTKSPHFKGLSSLLLMKRKYESQQVSLAMPLAAVSPLDPSVPPSGPSQPRNRPTPHAAPVRPIGKQRPFGKVFSVLDERVSCPSLLIAVRSPLLYGLSGG